MLEMLGRSSNQFSARHAGSGCLRAPLLILSPSACATVAHLFPSSSLPCTRKDGARDAGFPSSSLPRTCHQSFNFTPSRTCRFPNF